MATLTPTLTLTSTDAFAGQAINLSVTDSLSITAPYTDISKMATNDDIGNGAGIIIADEITELGDRFGSASLLIFGTAANAGTHAITGISGDGALIRITDHSGNTIVDTAATEFDDNFDFYFSFNYMTNS